MKILKRGLKWLPLAIFPIALLCTTVDLDLENIEESADDTIPPIITIEGEKVQIIDINTSYSPVVVTAYDSVDGDLTEAIDESGNIDTANTGTYKIYYTVYDLSLNKAKDSLVVTVVDPQSNDTLPPVLTINASSNPDTITVGDSWTNPTATAIDNGTDDISANIIVSGAVDTSKAGTYYLIYSITDLGNNTTTDTLTVVVKAESGTGAKPKLILTGKDTIFVALGGTYVEPGFVVVDTLGDTVNETVANALVVKTYYDSAGTQLASNVTLGNTEGFFNIQYYLEYSGATVIEWRTVIVTNEDMTPPVIKILGDDPDSVWNSDAANYADIDTGANAGAIAIDNGTDTLVVTVKDSVNMNVAGTYKIHYSATDSNNNTTDTFRVVIVRVDETAPVLTLSKSADTIDVGESWNDSMITATAMDNANGDLTSSITSSGQVNTAQKGIYDIIFTVKDAAENIASDTVKVYVFALPELVKLNGNNPDTVLLGTEIYIDSGALVTDNISDTIKDHPSYDKGSLNLDVAGIDTIHYTYTDADGNTTDTLSRVIVIFDAPDTIPPVITITGANPATIWQGQTYSDSGATAMDNKDGDISSSIAKDIQVDTATPGTYNVTYTVSDSAGNSDTAIREVIVLKDTVPPVITLNGDNPVVLWINDEYVESNASASDNVDGDLTSAIVKTGSVKSDSVGEYSITYTVSDAAGNESSVIRIVKVINYLVVEDFEAGEKGQIALYSDGDNGWWYGITQNDSQTIEPGTFEEMDPKVISSAAASDTLGLYAKFTISGNDYPWAQLSFSLKTSEQYYDLSSVDSITFKVKGSGTVRFSLSTQFVTDSADDWGHFGRTVSMPSSWTLITIKKADIVKNNDNSKITKTWAECSNAVTSVNFAVEGDIKETNKVVELYLDDIRFYGIKQIE